ncbi:hypothetical protein MKW92_005179, partial [Papaver armeniacum]
EYSEPTVDDAIKPKGYRMHLRFKPSLESFKDQKIYFEEMHRYNQARLSHQAKVRTSWKLLNGCAGSPDDSDKMGDTERTFTQTNLQLETNAQDIIKLTGVTVCPKVGGQGGKTVTGTLEAHVNGFRYTTSGVHPHIDFVYENVKRAFFRVGNDSMLPLLHFQLHNQIMVGTEETHHIKFHSDDDDEKDLQNFVDGVGDIWDSKTEQLNYFESPEHEFHGVLQTKAPVVFPLTLFSLVELVETHPIVVPLNEIEIVNLAQLRPNEIDMTVVFRDFSRDVLQINSIPFQSLDEIKFCLNFGSVKYYENKRELNWNDEVKKFIECPQKFIKNGGWESLNLEAGDVCDYCYWEEAGDSDLEEY